MRAFSVDRLLRSLLRRLKTLLKSSRVIRNLIADADNTEEFGNLYEHEQMIADSVRVDTYRAAIARQVRSDDVVVDLGTGTGILALFAVRNRPRKVYAIDHSPFIEVARRIAADNHVQDITFVRTNSRTFTPEESVDVILHEQMGDELFDENMVENILDLKKRTLKASGRIVPGKFELYLEPVCLKPEYRVPHVWETVVHDIDFRSLKRAADLEPFMRTAYMCRYLRWGSVDRFLCEPAPLLSFDLNEMSEPGELPRTAVASRIVTRSGTLDGLVLYFRVIFDEQASFDTSPLHTPTHWANRLFRSESREFQAGSPIEWSLTLNDPIEPQSWTVEVR